MRLRSRRRSRPSTALLLAAGAMAGLALGVLLSDRMGGFDGLLSRGRKAGEGGDEGRKETRRSRRARELAADDFNDADEYQDADEAGALASRTRTTASNRAARATSEMAAPTPARRSSPDEATLEARVLEAFHNDPILSERAIDIGAIGTGVIELTGWVQSRQEIGHAVTLARGVPDVSTVVDRLAVREVALRRESRNPVTAADQHTSDSPQPTRAD